MDVFRTQIRRSERVAATIPSGQSMTEVIDLGEQWMNGVRVPASAGWTNADLTFMGSMDGGVTYADVWDAGSEYKIAVGTGRTNATVYMTEPRIFAGFTHIRVRSGTAALPVSQGGARTLQISRIGI